MKHRFYSLSLLSLLIANTIGGICILCFHHHQINEYVESIVRNGSFHTSLVEVVLSGEEYGQVNWLKDNREFIYKGQMYDVVCSEVKNDTTIYLCLNDNIEERLIRDIVNNDNHTFPGQHQDSSVVLKFFKIISEIVIAPSVTSAIVADENRTSLFSCQNIFYPVYLSLSCEPPDIA